MSESLQTGFVLDRCWQRLRGEVDRSKEPDLAALLAVLSSSGVPYALIGGVALQVHQKEPCATIDIHIAVPDRETTPRESLVAAGFRETCRHEHSDNGVGPGGTPVQFTDDPALRESIGRAVGIPVGGLEPRVLGIEDLLHEKLRSGRDPARRRSKRLQDLADAAALIEQDPAPAAKLTPEEHQLLDELPD